MVLQMFVVEESSIEVVTRGVGELPPVIRCGVESVFRGVVLECLFRCCLLGKIGFKILLNNIFNILFRMAVGKDFQTSFLVFHE